MNINVGIMGEPAGWRLLLRQIGVPFRIMNGGIGREEVSVVVVSDGINRDQTGVLRGYLERGGAVLCSAKTYAEIFEIRTRTRKVDFFFEDDPVFNSAGIVDFFAKCTVPEGANGLKSCSGKYSAYIGTDKGSVIALPFDPGKVVNDRRTGFKSFYSAERRRPFEKVSLVSKGELRILVAEALEFLHHCRGLPFIHMWPFPDGAASAFCFRIDTDGGSEEQMKKLLRTVYQHRIPATWFVDVQGREKYLGQFAKMRGQEIAVHCFEHRVFRDYKDNLENLKKAREALRRVRLNARGFAAPYGDWNEGLGRAIKECGFEYSSEFSCGYDDLPFVPRVGDLDGVLQVPVHPICIGNLKRHGYDGQQMLRYFDTVLHRKLVLNEPVVFYHHPKDEHYWILDKIFEKIRQAKIPALPMREYARWWKNRNSNTPQFRYERGKVHVRGIKQDKSLYVRITWPDRAQAVVPVSGEIDLHRTKRQRKPPGWIMPGDYLRTRDFNYRIPLIRTLDALDNFFHGKRK